MKTAAIVLISVFLYINAYGQENDTLQTPRPEFQLIESFTLSPSTDCANQANVDIKNGEPRLIICFPNHHSFYSNQNEFEKKYGITYELIECTETNKPCIMAYNEQIFNHLKENFRNKWKKTVRKDVYGLK